jgi:thiol-disulfide isomerase/thioredoxin
MKVDTLAGLRETIESNDDVVVDFSALAWCVPCQKFYPHYRTVAEKLNNKVFVYVDVDSMDEEFKTEFPIQSVPTVFRYVNGEQTEVKSRSTIPLLRELS